MFRNILVCVDATPQSDAALAQAIDLAGCENARLTILTAMLRPPGWATASITAAGIEPLLGDLAREAQETLERAVGRVPHDIPVTRIFSEDPIRESLLARLEHADHDLVVLGTHGRGTLAAWLHHSLSRYALRHLRIPVLIVRAEAVDEPEAPERAVAAAAA